MTKQYFKYVLGFMLVVVLSSYAYAGIDLPWSTTYDCAAWTQSDGYGVNDVNCDGLTGKGSWTCDDGGTFEEQITSDANYSGGGGGKGQRHWEGDGQNEGSGGLNIAFNTVQTELWIRWYMRYASGFAWKNYSPIHYDKWLYIHTEDFVSNGNVAVIPEWQNDTVNIASQGPSINYNSSTAYGWTATMGGSTGDGVFHCYELHIKMDTNGSNGIIEFWIDGEQAISVSDADLGTESGWSDFTIGANQEDPDNGGCTAVDFDDIAVNNTGYIGPIGKTMSLTGGSQSISIGGGDKTITFGN